VRASMLEAVTSGNQTSLPSEMVRPLYSSSAAGGRLSLSAEDAGCVKPFTACAKPLASRCFCVKPFAALGYGSAVRARAVTWPSVSA